MNTEVSVVININHKSAKCIPNVAISYYNYYNDTINIIILCMDASKEPSELQNIYQNACAVLVGLCVLPFVCVHLNLILRLAF